METVNCGFLALLRQRIQCLKDRQLPAQCQENLLKRAELLALKPPQGSSSRLAADMLNREIMLELGIME